MSEYRKPPKPPFYDGALPGQCRVCGEYVLRSKGTINTRANWHPKCLIEYKLIHWPRETRKAVWSRDKGACADCGCRCDKRGWELDHRKPLVEAKGRIEYWKLPNLQTLCRDCHRKKTSAEATARAAARKKLKVSKPDK